LSYHAAAHLAGVDAGFIKPLEVPGTRAVRQAGMINRQGIEPSPAAQTLVSILERKCARLRSRR